jgi:hypothetical protein
MIIGPHGIAIKQADGTEVTISLAELIAAADAITGGTAAANKALILGANKNVDTLVIADGGLKLGSGAGTAVTATAAELNILDGVTATAAEINAMCDQSAGVQALAAAGAITADGTINRVTLAGGAYAFTLAAPGAAAIGKFLCIDHTGGGTDAKTLSLANVTGGSAATTASFNADGEGLLLFGAATKWVVVKEFGGVTLS